VKRADSDIQSDTASTPSSEHMISGPSSQGVVWDLADFQVQGGSFEWR
jgi:hypothetical protein